MPAMRQAALAQVEPAIPMDRPFVTGSGVDIASSAFDKNGFAVITDEVSSIELGSSYAASLGLDGVVPIQVASPAKPNGVTSRKKKKKKKKKRDSKDKRAAKDAAGRISPSP